MQEQEFVVQPMDRRAKRALIAVCAAVGAVLVALVVAALVYFLPPVALTDRASSPENGYWLYYHENDIGFEGGLAAGVTRSDDCDTQGDAALTQSVYVVLGQYTCRRSLGTLAGPSDSHLQEGVIRSIDILFAEETEGGAVQRSVVVYDDGTLLLDRTVYRMSASDANALMDDLLSVCAMQPQ